jgi:hypothetical protein
MIGSSKQFTQYVRIEKESGKRMSLFMDEEFDRKNIVKEFFS